MEVCIQCYVSFAQYLMLKVDASHRCSDHTYSSRASPKWGLQSFQTRIEPAPPVIGDLRISIAAGYFIQAVGAPEAAHDPQYTVPKYHYYSPHHLSS